MGETIQNDFAREANIEYINGVYMNLRHPDTFEVPTVEEKLKIKPGYFVKIGAKSPDGAGERFWVIVTKIEDGQIYGDVNNQLVVVNFEMGEEVIFPFEAVLDIMY